MKAQNISELLQDSLALGGRVIFFSDQAPAELQKIVQAATADAGAWPVVILSEKQVLEQKWSSSATDLVFVLPAQRERFQNWRASLQGLKVFVNADQILELQNANVWSEARKVATNRSAIQRLEGSGQSPCLFLDRDDVVVRNVPYNKEATQVVLMPGITKLINEAHAKGYWVALVTNQSGLGRGWVNWSQYQAVHQRMLQLLAAEGAWLDECVWASYYEAPGVEEGRLFANLRKPEAGMFQQVEQKLRVNMKKSIMVGDSASDLFAALEAQVGKLYLFHSEKSEKEKESLQKQKLSQYQFISNFSEVQL